MTGGVHGQRERGEREAVVRARVDREREESVRLPGGAWLSGGGGGAGRGWAAWRAEVAGPNSVQR
jgi:hypothetical protein